MNRSSRCLLALPTLALALAFPACSSSSNSGFAPGDDSGTPEGGGDDATTEAGSPETGTPDSTSPDTDATADSGETTETGGDAHEEAGNHADSGTEDSMAPEASTPEASTPEASTPEASTPDSSLDAAGSDGASVDGSALEAGTADASDGGGATFVPPTCDGVVSAGEYGNQTDGANQQSTSSGQTWYMTWSSTTVYVGITAANLAEGTVLYFSDDPAIAPDGGTASSGSTAGFTYDGVGIAQLPMHAQLVAYVKGGTYNETRAADGSGGWGTQTANALTVCTGANNTRELSIPWATITGGAIPSSFGWLGYAASSAGFVYGQVPQGNPAGTVGTSAVFPWLYDVTDATPVTGTLPFANAVQR